MLLLLLLFHLLLIEVLLVIGHELVWLDGVLLVLYLIIVRLLFNLLSNIITWDIILGCSCLLSLWMRVFSISRTDNTLGIILIESELIYLQMLLLVNKIDTIRFQLNHRAAIYTLAITITISLDLLHIEATFFPH